MARKLKEDDFTPKVCEDTNKTFGELTVLTQYTVRNPNNHKIKKYYNCMCSCGNTYSALKFSVQHGITTSCGCSIYKKLDENYNKIVVGDKINFLTLLTKPIRTKNGRTGDFLCECGEVKNILVNNVINGDTKSCGCYNKQRLKDCPIGFKLNRNMWEILGKEYSEGATVSFLADREGVSNDTIYRAIKLAGFTIDAKEDRALRGKSKVVDRSRFTDMECPTTAYYCGLLLADGCITGKTGNTLAFSLKSEDSYMVESLHEWLSATTKIQYNVDFDKRTNKTYKSTSIAITDHVIVNNLRKLGFEERKSMRERLPTIYANNRHFWRGMIDGDGCIVKTSWTVSLCGSLEICKGFSEFCKILGVKQNIRITDRKGLHVVSITNKADSKIVLDALYEDCEIFLSRKRNIYLEKYKGIK